MLSLILTAILASVALQDAAPQPPVFRAETYVVTFDISLGITRPFGIKRPYRVLAPEDVTIVLDKKTYPLVKLSQDLKKPGHYLLSFTPDDEYRDGASHLIELTVKMKPFRSPVTMPRTVVFPRPLAPPS